MKIKFNGIWSDSLGVVVEEFPQYVLPQCQKSTLSIPGKNGDALINAGGFENYVQSYKLYINAEAALLPSVMRSINNWLYAPSGYAVLEDDYDTTTYRLAYLDENIGIVNTQNKFGEFVINFKCAPKRYIKTQPINISLASAGVWEQEFTNPTVFEMTPTVELDLPNSAKDEFIVFRKHWGSVDSDMQTVTIFNDSAIGARKLIMDFEKGQIFGKNVSDEIVFFNNIQVEKNQLPGFSYPSIKGAETAKFRIECQNSPDMTGTILNNWWTL